MLFDYDHDHGHALQDAPPTLMRRADGTTIRLRDVAVTVDDYVRGHPWLALMTGVLLAGSVGYIAGRVAGMQQDHAHDGP